MNAIPMKAKRPVDLHKESLYTGNVMTKWQPIAVECHVMVQNIDSFTDTTGIPEGETAMPIKNRSVIIDYNDDGSPIRKHLQANTNDEMNDKIVAVYVKSGRIWEFMPCSGNESLHNGVEMKHGFSEYLKDWQHRRMGEGLRLNTIISDKRTIESHLLPYFGQMNLEDIGSDDVRGWLKHEKERGAAERSAALYLMKFRQIIKDAIRDGIISKDPSAGVKNPCKGKRGDVTLTEEQLQDIISNIHKLNDADNRLLLHILISTGVRRGEALALRWEDIDLRKREIHVHSNEVYNGNHSVEIGETKTEKGNRRLYVDDTLLAVLVNCESKEGFVLGGEQPWSKATYDRRWRAIKKTINMYGATPHSFRRTLFTIMNEQGVSVTDIQAYAGHENVQTTLEHYIKPTKEGMKKAGSVLDKVKKNIYAADMQGRAVI